jgi:hypothetical protein
MSGVGCEVLERFLQEVLLGVGGLFVYSVLFHKIFQEFLEESSYLG